MSSVETEIAGKKSCCTLTTLFGIAAWAFTQLNCFFSHSLSASSLVLIHLLLVSILFPVSPKSPNPTEHLFFSTFYFLLIFIFLFFGGLRKKIELDTLHSWVSYGYCTTFESPFIGRISMVPWGKRFGSTTPMWLD